MTKGKKFAKKACPYAGHDGCREKLAPQGLRMHIKSAHPGMQTSPGPDGEWPKFDAKASDSRKAPGLDTLDFLKEALESVKSKRLLLQAKINEVEGLRRDDESLSHEHSALQRAIEEVSGKREQSLRPPNGQRRSAAHA